MALTPLGLLRNRDAFWTALREGRLRRRDLAALVAFVVFACAVYGVALAGWRSPRLAAYVAVKLPILFVGTTAVVAVFNWMVAAALGAGLRFRSMLFVVFAAMAIAGWILLALAPVALFFVTTGAPRTGSDAQLRYAHNGILVTHIAVLALAGLAGNAALCGGLRRVVRPGCPVWALLGAWMAAFAFVGCQAAWILRPFVGSPFYPVAFIRPDCLDRNFYEFVFGEVIPYLMRGGL
jgi:hypothetical protein